MSGTPVRVFSVAKTVADCFRYRGRIGLDTAVDGLRRSSGRSGPRLSRSCTALRSIGSIP